MTDMLLKSYSHSLMQKTILPLIFFINKKLLYLYCICRCMLPKFIRNVVRNLYCSHPTSLTYIFFFNFGFCKKCCSVYFISFIIRLINDRNARNLEHLIILKVSCGFLCNNTGEKFFKFLLS